MGSVFAIQVKTGSEINAKEQLKKLFLREGEPLLKGIYALETHTQIITKNTENNEVDFNVDENDISTHLTKKKYNSVIGNLQKQYNKIKDHKKICSTIKESYKNEISRLKSELKNVTRKSKRLHCVMSGYILIELKTNSEYMPNHIWHLINSSDLVQKILSTNPIPEEEVEFFFSNMAKITEPEVILTFDEELDYETLDDKVTELLTEANKTSSPNEFPKKEKILDDIDELLFNVVDKTRKIIKEKSNRFRFLNKIKAFVMRKKRCVSMPLSLYYALYNREERTKLNELLNGREFLKRLKQFTYHSGYGAVVS